MRCDRVGFRKVMFAWSLGVLALVSGCVNQFRLPTQPATTVNITGVVRTLGGDTPVAGATVEVNNRSTTTGTDGTYALADVLVPDGRAWFTVSAPAHSTRTGSVAATQGTALQLDIALPSVALQGTGTVVGTVNFAAPKFGLDDMCDNAGSVLGATATNQHYLQADETPTEVIVDVAGAPTDELAARLAQATGAQGYRVSKLIHRIMLTVPAGSDIDSFIHRVKMQPEVLDAYSNSVSLVSSPPPDWYAVPPNDFCYPSLHHLQQINAPWAWTQTTGDPGIIVAVVDTGVNPNHPDLRDNLIPGWNFIEDNDSMTDLTGHGSHVSGIIGAVANNHTGVTGVAWNVSIMPVRVARIFSATAEATTAGITYAVDQGANVINVSMNSVYDAQPVRNAFEYAVSRGVIVVASVGNSGPDPNSTMYPVLYDGVIGVGALSTMGRATIGDFSARGQGVDFVAPGEQVWSTTHLGYTAAIGTSTSAPVVTGVIALMLSNGIAPDEVEDVLRRTAVRIGNPDVSLTDRHTYGYGLVNAYGAVMGVDPADAVMFVMNQEGERVGTVTSPDGERRFAITEVPEGSALFLAGWIDVNRNGLLDVGDYYGVAPFSMDAGGERSVNLSFDVYDLEETVSFGFVP